MLDPVLKRGSGQAIELKANEVMRLPLSVHKCIRYVSVQEVLAVDHYAGMCELTETECPKIKTVRG